MRTGGGKGKGRGKEGEDVCSEGSGGGGGGYIPSDDQIFFSFAFSFLFSSLRPMQFPKECDSEGRERERERGLESHPMTAVNALFIRNISLISPNIEFRWKVTGWPGCGWGRGRDLAKLTRRKKDAGKAL